MKKYKYSLILACIMTLVASNTFSQSGVKYPYLILNDSEGPIIVSRDSKGGIYQIAKVAGQLQVNKADVAPYEIEYSLSYCPSGWRLPTIEELTLMYLGGGTPYAPALFKDANGNVNDIYHSFPHPGLDEGTYWSSTAGDGPYIAVFNFANGTAIFKSTSMDKAKMRCVRAVN